MIENVLNVFKLTQIRVIPPKIEAMGRGTGQLIDKRLVWLLWRWCAPQLWMRCWRWRYRLRKRRNRCQTRWRRRPILWKTDNPSNSLSFHWMKSIDKCQDKIEYQTYTCIYDIDEIQDKFTSNKDNQQIIN